MAQEENTIDSHQTKGIRVLLVDDEQDILDMLQMAIRKMGFEVDTAGNVQGAIKKLQAQRYSLCLTDMRLPDGDGLQVVQHIAQNNLDIPCAVITAHGNMENAIAALKVGAFDYLAKPVSLAQLRVLIKSALNLPQQDAGEAVSEKMLIGQSPAMQKARDLIARVARSEASVHITGESGSGKEVAARLIAQSGARHNKPFIAVNCGAIPSTLVENEFFGYKKGAFTGADKDRDGFFHAAHGGTLFLDEVADLPLAMQVKLLRAIQEKKVRKIGATSEESVDVRIISATHYDLAERVRQNLFRQDLYFRLNVIPIQMPALREMRDDISKIAQQVLDRLRGESAAHFSDEAMRALKSYSFPGNVRELENAIERALTLCMGGVIEAQDLMLMSVEHGQVDKTAITGKYPLPDYLDKVEKQALEEALDQTNFNRTEAAKLLGLTFRTMRYRMERLGIKAPGEMDDAD
ncbi:MAG: sigma-54 dependent transcriptional regulator [Gallionella sp.]